MLLSLTIRNVVLIDKLELSFSDGLSILTGETGAGKSILIDSLGLVLGNRAESRLIRRGSDQASVSAEFDISKAKSVKKILEEHDIEVEDTLLVRRTIAPDGKSKAYLNDNPVGVGLLQQVSEQLVEIHGQHDQKGLLNPSNHRSMLDSYAGLGIELDKLEECFSEWKNKSIELQEMGARIEKAKLEQDYLIHALKEFDDLDPQPGEEEKLAAQRTFMHNRERILETLNSALAEIKDNNDVISNLQAASRILMRSTVNNDNLFTAAIEQLDKAVIESSEAVSLLENMRDGGDSDLSNLEQIEERLFSLRALARKHKKTVDELSEYKLELQKQVSLLDDTEERLADLEKEVAGLKKEYSQHADAITSKRRIAADKLEKSLVEELAPLKMAGCKLKVEMERLDEDKWSVFGKEKMQFLLQTNPGSSFGPLNKIASGGELSRFMLAMKVVLSDVKSTPTLIFDEIDTGIGGATADAVGKRLSSLGKKFQVLTITHQPQVAAYGDQHMRVEKLQRDNSTITNVSLLTGKQKKEEVARMLAGATITKEARAAAEKLMGMK